jgi:hypothetical protein
MKYLCLIYYDEVRAAALPEAEYLRIAGEAVAYGEELSGKGQFLASAALQPTENATTIRMQGGKVTVTDGPFAETKEQLGGFFLVEARDLNEAIRIASKIPPAKLGCIEIRPVKECVGLDE